MNVLMMAASMRKESCNKKLINQAVNLVKEAGHTANLVEFESFDIPLYNGDLEESTGIPKGVQDFMVKVEQADCVIFSSPEYNYSIPGTFKNLIDWVSLKDPTPWAGSRILLLSASPALVGGNRGLWNCRIPLEGCGAFVYPHMFSLPSAYDAFNDNGDFADPKNVKRLSKVVAEFLLHVAS